MKKLARTSLLTAAAIALGTSLFVQFSHPAFAAKTLYPVAASATLTPDDLLW